MNHIANIKWNLVIIDDSDFLNKEIFINVFGLLLTQINFQYIIIDSLDGSGENWIISSLQEKKNEVLFLERFLNVFNKIKQLDWGDFFLFKDYPIDWNNPKKAPYPFVIKQSDTTIRAIDNQYLYIYTPYKEIVSILCKSSYTIESITVDFLENLPYPE